MVKTNTELLREINERRAAIYAKDKKNQRIQFAIMISALVIITFITILLSSNVKAELREEKEHMVISVKIQKDDTIWGIAQNIIKEYDLDMSTKQLVKEIEKSNNIDVDHIQNGDYIIVPFDK